MENNNGSHISFNGNSNNNDSEVINLRELIFKYVQRWYWFVFAVILALVIATIYLKKAENQYQVQTTILIRNDNTTPGVSQMAMMESLGFTGVSREVEDEIQVISSKKLVRQAIDSLGMQITYYEKDGLKYIDKYNETPFRINVSKQFLQDLQHPVNITLTESNGNYKVVFKYNNQEEKFKLKNIQEPFKTSLGIFNFTASSNLKEDDKYRIVIMPINPLIDIYSNKLNVASVNKQSNVIKISIVESNINKGKDFLNKIVTLYNQDAIDDKNLIARNTAAFINDRLAIITKELFDVESNVENYKRANKLTDLTSEANLYLETAGDYEKKLTEIETQYNMVQAVENYIRNPHNFTSLIPANIITDDPTLAKSIQEYNAAILERMRLSQTANDKNPALVLADQQINALRANVLASVNSVKSAIQIAKNDLMRKESQFNTKITNVPTQERQFLEIKRQQEIKQNLYLFLSQKREENALSLASTAPAARTIDKAYASLAPVAPKRMIIYLVALIIGLLIPFVYIYIKDLINNRIEDSKELQRLVKAPYLGNTCISYENDRLVVREGRTTPIVEMFRLIRTNLQFLIGNKKSPVILITSSISGEGKSFTSMNLAMTFALMQKKVVLVGLDIRNPSLGDFLHLSKENGVTIFLTDENITEEDIIINSPVYEYLDVIPAGPIPPNPSELLMSKRLDELFANLKNKYDYIVVDTAPIGVVSDTYLLNRIADNFIFVTRQKYTPKDATQLINEVYAEKRLNGIGVVLNGTPASSGRGYGYRYGYGYGYGYGHKKVDYTPKLSFGERINQFSENFKRRFSKK